MNDLFSTRSLHVDDLDTWAEFCAMCFSKKAKAPSKHHFLDHYTLDPWKLVSNILIVVETSTNEFVSTLRVFNRNYFTNEKAIIMYGIGEVCTHPAFQRRGLSSISTCI